MRDGACNTRSYRSLPIGNDQPINEFYGLLQSSNQLIASAERSCYCMHVLAVIMIVCNIAMHA